MGDAFWSSTGWIYILFFLFSAYQLRKFVKEWSEHNTEDLKLISHRKDEMIKFIENEKILFIHSTSNSSLSITKNNIIVLYDKIPFKDIKYIEKIDEGYNGYFAGIKIYTLKDEIYKYNFCGNSHQSGHRKEFKKFITILKGLNISINDL